MNIVVITDVNEAPEFVDADSNENPDTVNPSVVMPLWRTLPGRPCKVGNYSCDRSG